MTRVILSATFVISMILATACGGYSSGPGSITSQSDQVSNCGGFEQQGDALFDAGLPYCDAEVLHWRYDAATGILELADARILLNCCGIHSMQIAEQDGVYVITERDEPEFDNARCACMCVYDFTIEASGIAEGVIPLRIEREVTDWEEGSGLVWEGELDLSQGSGSVVIDETDVGPWCGDVV